MYSKKGISIIDADHHERNYTIIENLKILLGIKLLSLFVNNEVVGLVTYKNQ